MAAYSNAARMVVLMLCLVASFALMFAFAMVCANVAHDVALFFVLAEAVALSLVAIVFGVLKSKRTSEER